MTRRPFSNHQPLNPRRCSIAIDANALNRDGSARDVLVARLMKLYEEATINLLVPKGVRVEVLDARTPDHIRDAAMPMIFSYKVGLNTEEQERRKLIEHELQGNASPGKHIADADHLFEASKYAGYFITEDQRILSRSGRMRELLPPSLTVVTLAGFLQIFDDYEAGRLI